MPEASFLVEMVKVIGFPAVIFVMWYLDLRSRDKKEAAARESNEKIYQDTKTTFTTLIENMEKNSNKHFDLLKEMLEINNYQGSLLIKMEEHLRTNQYCPYVRKEFHKNESRNSAA